jgi:hypothetical protein
MTHRGHFVGELFSRPTTPRSKGDAAMEPWVPGRSCTAGGLDAAMESRVPSISSGARHSDYHQVRCRKLRVARREWHGLAGERDQRRCQRSTSKGKIERPKHPLFPPIARRTTIVDRGVVLKGSPEGNTLPSLMKYPSRRRG